MTILDVGLFTGFEPVTDDLEAVSGAKNKLILIKKEIYLNRIQSMDDGIVQRNYCSLFEKCMKRKHMSWINVIELFSYNLQLKNNDTLGVGRYELNDRSVVFYLDTVSTVVW